MTSSGHRLSSDPLLNPRTPATPTLAVKSRSLVRVQDHQDIVNEVKARQDDRRKGLEGVAEDLKVLKTELSGRPASSSNDLEQELASCIESSSTSMKSSTRSKELQAFSTTIQIGDVQTAQGQFQTFTLLRWDSGVKSDDHGSDTDREHETLRLRRHLSVWSNIAIDKAAKTDR